MSKYENPRNCCCQSSEEQVGLFQTKHDGSRYTRNGKHLNHLHRDELTLFSKLNQRYDEHDQHHLLRLKDTFIHKKHLCLVFELLSVNLYELIKQNHFRGLSTNLVRVFTAQILDALTVLNEARIIHCDLKPENILLKKYNHQQR